ncbi:MAG: hypothetical protein KAJ06_09205 [Gammaproteobacteria bacterium]|nr:hypothetical protein [Gammaproteobacteria bacterium]
MGKQPTSTTQNTFPPWLMKALQPLMGGAAENMQQFMGQGFNVLQGRPAGEGAGYTPPTRANTQAPKIDWAELAKGMGGGNA